MININRLIISIILICIVISCNTYEPKPPYNYNYHPIFTMGKVEFYGNYYGKYNNPNNVSSIYLFSDSLKTDENGNVTGNGQELILEDLYTPASETLFPIGGYKKRDSTEEKFSFAPGRNLFINNEEVILGSRILFVEKEIKRSITKLIVDGSISITATNDSTMNIVCDLTTEDKKNIKGSFKGKLEFHNNSISKISSRKNQ